MKYVFIEQQAKSHRVILLCHTLAHWRARPESHDVELLFIQLGKPQQNAYIEHYNRTVRYDGLSHYIFDSIAEAQDEVAMDLQSRKAEYGTGWLHTQTTTGADSALTSTFGFG